MSEFTTTWSGEYPNLCSGKWTLYKDGVPLNIDIPFQGEPANTYGIYQGWNFGYGWEEYFFSYDDGIDCETWCANYHSWLSSFADESDFPKVFAAFQANDWRHGSCGGCI